MAQKLAERLCGDAACRDDPRGTRRLRHKPLAGGVYREDKVALLEDFFHFLQELALVNLMNYIQGKAVRRTMVPFVQ